MKRDLMNAFWLLVVLAAMSQSCGRKGDVGAQGSQGIPGVAGSTGAQGNPGVNGSNGSDGSNGTSVTLVQFCHGTTHFPDTFCEVGFCIGGNLYATYSAHDGFSSYIPNGTYSSNGINCSCNFTVATNCQVSQ